MPHWSTDKRLILRGGQEDERDRDISIGESSEEPVLQQEGKQGGHEYTAADQKRFGTGIPGGGRIQETIDNQPQALAMRAMLMKEQLYEPGVAIEQRAQEIPLVVKQHVHRVSGDEGEEANSQQRHCRHHRQCRQPAGHWSSRVQAISRSRNSTVCYRTWRCRPGHWPAKYRSSG